MQAILLRCSLVEGDIGRINLKLTKKLESLGTIEVVFQGIRNVRDGGKPSQLKIMTGADVVPEKALKGEAKTHAATYRRPEL